ncbi:RNA polymerase sigma factor [Archangium minus]|uniref:RNA polymerase sigma factor n=2 Tax=Archangiaceae TaxID=39 RepID=A0ABY9WQ14_9BACT|nr:RNA polymerase sigma factor [Archangium minus]
MARPGWRGVMKEQVNPGGDDPSLIGEVARGSRDAFVRLYQRYAGRLLGYALKVTRDQSLAEDVVQEVFTTVWLKASSYRPEQGAPAAWIYRIAHNKLVDHWRRRLRVDEAAQQVPEQGPQPPSELALDLEHSMAGLSPDQQRAVELTCLRGYSHEEAAAMLDVPLGTLKSRIRQALGRMRLLLTREET